MFSIGLKPTLRVDPLAILFTDNSTGDETVTAAHLAITKINLQPVTYPFVSPFTIGVYSLLLGILDKDYALDVVYTVVTNADTYVQEYQFVTLSHVNLFKKNRLFVDKTKLSQADLEAFNKQTVEINAFRLEAKDRCRFSDLIGAQKALDYLADMKINNPYSFTC